jgi:hypothetical protein
MAEQGDTGLDRAAPVGLAHRFRPNSTTRGADRLVDAGRTVEERDRETSALWRLSFLPVCLGS